MAAWYYPDATPPNTSLSSNFVFNPATENFNLNGKSLKNAGELCLGTSCITSWSGGTGGGTGTSYWLQNGTNVYYNDGNVGIGTQTPATKLSIYDASSGPIVTLSGANGNYRGITIKNTADNTEQWFYGANNNNNFVIRRSGASPDYLTINASNNHLGLGIAPDNNAMIKTSASSNGVVGLYAENNLIDYYNVTNPINIGVKGVAETEVGGGVGVSGTGYFGVKGSGFNGVHGEATVASGYGIYGKQGIGSRAGFFDGDTQVTGHLIMSGSSKYLNITNGSVTPPSGDCAAAFVGRMYLDKVASRLYLCTGSSPAWKSVVLN